MTVPFYIISLASARRFTNRSRAVRKSFDTIAVGGLGHALAAFGGRVQKCLNKKCASCVAIGDNLHPI